MEILLLDNWDRIACSLYPSGLLSGFKRDQYTEGKQSSMGMKSGMIRSSLCVSKFAVSIFLCCYDRSVLINWDYINKKNWL